MYPKPIERLIELFQKLPGVGPRQATRMALFSVRDDGQYAKALSDSLLYAKKGVAFCAECFRTVDRAAGALCDICSNLKRKNGSLCIVEKELDLINIERSGSFQGTYHVLGGTLVLLDPESPEKLKLRDLYKRIEKLIESTDSSEVILATSQTTEGDSTANYIERMLDPLKSQYAGLSVSRLGRGLSFGSEIEYADQVTLQDALQNRKKTS